MKNKSHTNSPEIHLKDGDIFRFIVTMKASPANENKKISYYKCIESMKKAIENCLKNGEENGFDHPMSFQICIEVGNVFFYY